MLQEYYNRRAREYDSIYMVADPERQVELASLGEAMIEHLAGRSILEVACGTGHWTHVMSLHAPKITATDASPHMLAEAELKALPAENVRFLQADAFDLAAVPGRFDAGLANFWVSHVPRSRLSEFFGGFHRRLQAGAHVFIADNVYVEGLGGDLVSVAGDENTYKRRKLQDGTEYLVLKNYYESAELRTLLGGISTGLQIYFGRHYWWLRYSLADG